MIPKYNKVHNKFKLNSFHYSFNELRDVAYSFIKEGELYQQQIGEFLLDWTDKKSTIKVSTSGSTGSPKRISIKKQHMVNSAIATGDFFKLKPGDKALHCLPAEFIAGKMMLVRAIILGLEIDCVEPNATPYIQSGRRYDFCAMVPLQLENSLNGIKNIRCLIVGGAPVSFNLNQKLEKLKTKIYETYGMTETVTHIAVRLLNTKEKSEYFHVLPEVIISQDNRGCLVIAAPHLTTNSVVTNDIVELRPKTAFKLLGRIDNVINSGGVKLFPEQIEKKLSSQITTPFFVAALKDDKLGEKLVLLTESKDYSSKLSTFTNLDKFERPKMAYCIPQFIRTKTNKINRSKTLDLLKQDVNSIK